MKKEKTFNGLLAINTQILFPGANPIQGYLPDSGNISGTNRAMAIS